MTVKEIKALVKKFNGWWEGDTARFPTPHEKDQFLKAVKEAKAASR